MRYHVAEELEVNTRCKQHNPHLLSSSTSAMNAVSYLSELPNRYANKYQSPASVAAAIDDMADAIVTKAAQKAKEAIENAACHDPETKLQSALG